MENQKITPKVIRTVWNHWKPSFDKSKMTLAGTVFFYSLTMYIDLMFRPTQWKNVFDGLSTGHSPWPAFTRIILATCAGWLTGRLGEACIIVTESRIIKELKDYCLKDLLGKSTHFFSMHSSGGLVAKSKRFALGSEMVIDEFVFSIIKSCFFIVYLIVYSWMLIPELTPVFAIWTTAFLAMTVVLSRMRMTFDLKSSKTDSVTTGYVSDILLSVFTLRVFSAIPRICTAFEAVTADEEAKRKTAWYFGNLQWALQSLLVLLLELYCMNIIIGKVLVHTYTIGTAVMVQAYIATFSLYMWGFGRSLIKVRTAFADAYEMAELLDEESSEPICHQEESVPQSNGVSLSNVTFGYGDNAPALRDFSFDFVAGRRYGLIGETGSGKSTLIKLLLQFYQHHEGQIAVCNADVIPLNKLTLRSWISYVPQDPHFPSWTIRDIIAMGKPDATDAEIRIAAEKASCGFIWKKLPHQLDTVIGENGVKLSGGEKQRIAIAAAILKDGPIVIMDEPTSALDPRTEHSIQRAIQEHFVGKTLIVIAHRLSTVAILDEVILLENGRVKDYGHHDTLLETSENYREMWELQTNPQTT